MIVTTSSVNFSASTPDFFNPIWPEMNNKPFADTQVLNGPTDGAISIEL
jgi:hypothetical protein